MQPTVKAVRAIATLFARRIFLPVAITAGVIAVILIVAMVWLITIDLWWLLLAIPVFLLILAALIVGTIVWVIIQLVTPKQTKTQRVHVASFVDKMQRVSEIVATPKFILLFRTIKDIVVPSKAAFVKDVATDTLSLKKDFQALQDLFREDK